MSAGPLTRLVAAVEQAKTDRATGPLTYRVVRRGRESSANWTSELAGIPAELLTQAEAVRDAGNRKHGFQAYDVWSF
jgi:hypothetical protein